MSALEDAALAWYNAGASVLPAIRDKRPAVDWKRYQTERMTSDVLAAYDWPGIDGFGIVTGYGGFEMLELEGRAAHLFAPLMESLPSDIASELMTYVERTPSGGYHFVYTVKGEQGGSTQLARMPDASVPAGFRVLIETRGKYAWTVMAPSGGSIHVEISNGKWEIVNGTPGVVPFFTEEQREILFDCCREFDELPPPPPVDHRQPLQMAPGGLLAPGQDYEARTAWPDLLEPLGWHAWRREGDKVKWTRPGKKFGTSATTNYDGNDNLYVFTSSTEFPAFTSWTKFAVYALTQHDGDYAKAASALRKEGYGSPQEPFDVRDLVGENPVEDPPDDAAEENSSAQFSLTDDGNALLLVEVEHECLHYSPERAQWLHWTGGRWQVDPDDTAAVQAMRTIVRSWRPSTDPAKKHRDRSLGFRAIENAVKLARRDPAIQVSIDELDADPYVLNTPDGVVNLITSELSPPTPAALHTKMTLVAPDFDRRPERWLRFLNEIMLGAQEPAKMVDFIQRLAGYSATGKVTHHVLPFLHGSGGNGKTVFLEVLQAILGDYSGTAPADFLLAGKDVHESYTADLAGRRLVVCSEIPPTAKFNEQKVKNLTGGDRLSGRFNYGNPFLFNPSHHLWLLGNHQPRVDAGGKSLWRRLRLIPFLYEIPEKDQQEGLADQLIHEEGAAILAWIITGARLQIVGLNEPTEVTVATTEYAEEEDHLGRFMNEMVRIGGDPRIVYTLITSVYDAYVSWCYTEGIKTPLAKHVFGREMKTRGIKKWASNGKTYYLSVDLNKPNIDPSDLIDRPEQTAWNDRG